MLSSLGYNHAENLKSSNSTYVASVYRTKDQRVVKIAKCSSQELLILQQIGGKDHIIPLINSTPITIPNMSNDYVLLEMPYKENRAIQSAEELKLFFRQLIETMLFLHDHSIYYRDFKIGNVRWDGSYLTLIDFNCSMLFKDSKDYPSNLCVGTKGYIAPEVLDKKKLSDIRADVWSIGVMIAYEWLRLYRGVYAADSILNNGCENVFRDLSTSKAPPDLVDLLSKMLQIDPDLRIKGKDIIEHHYFIP